MIKIKSIYQIPEEEDGFRIMVDSIWPDQTSKQKSRVDLWLKEIAPSIELIKWFNKDLKRWSEFKERYRQELKDKSTLISIIRDTEKKNGTVTLLYAARNEELNSAVVLRDKIRGYNVITTSVDRIHG